MKSITIYDICLGLYLIYWITFIIGIQLIRKKIQFAEKLLEYYWRGRINQFKYPPFSNLLKLWIENKYFLSSLFFILIIISAATLYFIIGTIVIFPVIAISQGLMVGIALGKVDKKNMLWSIAVLLFEFGYFSISGALGLSISLGLIFNDISFTESFVLGINNLFSTIGVLLIICIMGNAFLEIAGPIYWNMKGALGLDVLANRQNINENT